MRKTIDAIYEKGVFRPLEPVMLPEGEHVQVAVPEVTAKTQRRLAALDAFYAAFKDLSQEQWKRFDEAVRRRPWFGDRKLGL